MEPYPIDGNPTPRTRRGRPGRAWFLGLILFGFLLSFAVRGEAWEAMLAVVTGHQLEVAGPPAAANDPRLSEHNIEWVETQEAQVQAEFLLASAIRHEHGATDLIAQYVDGWRGQLRRTPKWEVLTQTALYSRDLRVRAAAIEIDLSVHGVEKSDARVESLIELGIEREDQRPWVTWTLGMLANRGLQPQRIHDLLVEYTYDPVEETRLWAVEGLAHIGTDATIAEFIRVLGTDPSMLVRERAGCSLAKSGMLTRGQRMKAVPGLIALAEDPSTGDRTLRWVFQALREITGVKLPDDPAEWRYWHAKHGDEVVREFENDTWRVLGNN